MKKMIPYYFLVLATFICDYFFATSLIDFNPYRLLLFYIGSSAFGLFADLLYQNLLENFNHNIRLNFLNSRLAHPLQKTIEESLNFLQENLPKAIDYFGTKIKFFEITLKVLAYTIALLIKTPPQLIISMWPFFILLPFAFFMRTFIKSLGENLYKKSMELNKNFIQIILNATYLRLHGLEKKGIDKSQTHLKEQKKLILKAHTMASIAQKLPQLIYLILFLFFLNNFELKQSLPLFYLGYKLIQNFSDLINFYSNIDLFKTQYNEALIYADKIVSPTASAFKFASPPSLSFSNYNINGGGMLFIHGPSGSGKTTLLHQLIQLKPGIEVLWNKRKISIDELKHSLAYVGAENFFIDGSVKENLLLGLNFNPSDEEILKALNYFYIDDIILKKNNKLNESITNFSSGEKQRIALSRALLRKPTIFILDEATRHLDVDLTQRIVHRINDLKSTATLLISDHNIAFKGLADVEIAVNNI